MARVLVTGATGFLGNHLINELLRSGHQVIATSRDKERAKRCSWFSAVIYKPFDLTDTSITNLFHFFESPDILVHLAWEGLPNYMAEFHVTNALPAQRAFLQNLITGGLRRVTVTGTCFEYGMREGCLSEDMPAKPTNNYAIAKNELRIFLETLAREYIVELNWLRLFYLYGEGQHPKSLFSQLKSALAAGEEEFNMSPGDQLRDYLPVETAVAYIHKILTRDAGVGIVNCCSGKPISVRGIVEMYLSGIGKHIKLNLGYYPYSDIEPRNFWGDTEKLNSIL